MTRPNPSAYLLIAPDTRDKKGREAFLEFAKEFRRIFPGRQVEPSFLGLSHPSIAEGIEACIKEGAVEIFVLPLMLFRGRHVRHDIPTEIQAAKRKFPEVDFHYAGAPALKEPKMLEPLRSKISKLRKQKPTHSLK